MINTEMMMMMMMTLLMNINKWWADLKKTSREAERREKDPALNSRKSHDRGIIAHAAPRCDIISLTS